MCTLALSRIKLVTTMMKQECAHTTSNSLHSAQRTYTSSKHIVCADRIVRAPFARTHEHMPQRNVRSNERATRSLPLPSLVPTVQPSVAALEDANETRLPRSVVRERVRLQHAAKLIGLWLIERYCATLAVFPLAPMRSNVDFQLWARRCAVDRRRSDFAFPTLSCLGEWAFELWMEEVSLKRALKNWRFANSGLRTRTLAKPRDESAGVFDLCTNGNNTRRVFCDVTSETRCDGIGVRLRYRHIRPSCFARARALVWARAHDDTRNSTQPRVVALL